MKATPSVLGLGGHGQADQGSAHTLCPLQRARMAWLTLPTYISPETSIPSLPQPCQAALLPRVVGVPHHPCHGTGQMTSSLPLVSLLAAPGAGALSCSPLAQCLALVGTDSSVWALLQASLQVMEAPPPRKAGAPADAPCAPRSSGSPRPGRARPRAASPGPGQHPCAAGRQAAPRPPSAGSGLQLAG